MEIYKLDEKIIRKEEYKHELEKANVQEPEKNNFQEPKKAKVQEQEKLIPSDMADYIYTLQFEKGIIKCDNCSEFCNNSQGNIMSNFMTTQFGGKLCGTSCAVNWTNNYLKTGRTNYYKTEKKAL